MKKAQDGVKTPSEKEKVDAAIKAQKQKDAAIARKEKARRDKNLEVNRRARLPLAEQARLRAAERKTTLPAGEGSLRKYMNAGTNPLGSTKGPVKVGGKPDAPAPKKVTGSGGGKRKVTRTASVAVSGPKREMPSGMTKPSAPGVSAKPAARQLSQREGKIAQLTSKIKSGEGSTAVNQAKIKALKAKEAMAKQKAMRKEKRAAVKAVKQSYK